MTVTDILNALRERTSIRVARRLLAINKFPKGSGWEQIIEKLDDPAVKALADTAGLQRSLRDLLIVGDKNVRVFKLSAVDADVLRGKISSIIINKSNVFSKYFPLSVPENLLNTLSAQAPVPIESFQTNDVYGLIFSSIEIIDRREKLNALKIGQAVSASYDEVIGIRRIKIQTFNALMISKKTNYAYILSDAYQDHGQSMRWGLQLSIANAINKLIGRVIIPKSVNFLPVIRPLYDSASGSVKTFLWNTTTSSGKHEWMRGRDTCLRKEDAHKAAIEMVAGRFEPYGIELEWTLEKIETYIPCPTLSVLGTYRMLLEPNPYLGDATISGCASLSEFEFVLKELMVHVSGSKTI